MIASQQVIAAVVARLIAASTSAGQRVYSDRFYPISILPAIKVKHVGEDLQAADDDITWPKQRLHNLELEIVAYVQAVAGLDDALAAMAAEVLTALEGSLAAVTLSPLVGVQISATNIRYEAQNDGPAATGAATLRVEVDYHTASNDPTTFI